MSSKPTGAHDHPPANTPDEHLSLAKASREKAEWAHAATHAGQALALAPGRADVLAEADALVQAAPQPLDLTPLGQEVFIGTVLLRVRTLGHLGQIDDALELLLGLTLATKSNLLVPWLKELTQKAPAVDAKRLATSVGMFVQGFGQPDGSDAQDELLETLEEWLGDVREKLEPGGPLAVAHVRLAQLAGMLQGALGLGKTAFQKAPGYETAIALAHAQRGVDNADECVAAFQKALEYRPGDVPVLLDLSEIAMARNDAQTAANLYQQVLQKEPQHPWAYPSLLFVRLRAGGDLKARDELVAYARANPENERARMLLEAITPYVGILPGPGQLIVGAVVELLGREGVQQAQELRVKLPQLEAPSACIAASEATRRGAANAALNIEVEGLQEPDPREPVSAVEWRLWQYDGPHAAPGLPPPPVQIVEPIARLALSPFHIGAWRQMARQLARATPPPPAEQVLATMIHMPATPPQVAPWAFRYSVQVAAAMVLAQLEDAWEGSFRRKALVSALHGPIDWATSAAAVALADVALTEQQHAPDIAQLLLALWARRPQNGALWSPEHAVLAALVRIPGVPDAEREQARLALQKLESQQEQPAA